MVNALHRDEGYYNIKAHTSTSFSTTAPFSGGGVSVSALHVSTIGNNKPVVAYITKATAPSFGLAVPHTGGANFTSVAMPSLTSETAGSIDFFSVAELEQSFVMAAQASGSLASGGSTTVALSGTVTYSITSV